MIKLGHSIEYHHRYAVNSNKRSAVLGLSLGLLSNAMVQNRCKFTHRIISYMLFILETCDIVYSETKEMYFKRRVYENCVYFDRVTVTKFDPHLANSLLLRINRYVYF